jgi:hypothetical protein
MFTRDARTGNLLPGNMTWLSGMGSAEPSMTILTDFSNTTDPIYQQIRVLSHQMAPVKQAIDAQLNNVADADATVDWQGLAQNTLTLDAMHTDFNALVAQWKGSNPYIRDLALAESWTAFMVEWARSTIQALPDIPAMATNAVVGAVNTVVNGLGRIASNAGVVTFKAMIPFLAIGMVLILLVKQAETSRTWRKKVA